MGFDVFFGRGSLEAMEYEDREGYISVIRTLLNNNFSYHLSGFVYDPQTKSGPPRPLPLDVVCQLFKGFKVNQLASDECPEVKERFKVPEICRIPTILQVNKIVYSAPCKPSQ